MKKSATVFHPFSGGWGGRLLVVFHNPPLEQPARFLLQ
jgi:hypothetical protein